jgi:hypothetical protein
MVNFQTLATKSRPAAAQETEIISVDQNAKAAK